MKANQKFTNADEAVSPVIGVILMVAITVVLAAVVFVLVNNLTGDTAASPIAVIGATGDSENDIITLKHDQGDTLLDGDMEISVVFVGSPPSYIDCSPAFEAGDRIIIHTLTSSAATTCPVNGDLKSTTVTLNWDGAGYVGASGDQDVQIIVRHTSSGSVLFDRVVELNI
jgi:flagellin-like protein